MRFFIKQHVFTWTDRFSIYNEQGGEAYYAEGEGFSFGRRLHLMDSYGTERAFLQQKVFSFRPRYFVFQGDRQVAEITQEFSFFKPQYFVDGLGWTVSGDFFAHEFEIYNGVSLIARVSKEWFSWGDAYAIDVDPYVDEGLALAVVLALDAMMADQG